jgi:hypothetical protein
LAVFLLKIVTTDEQKQDLPGIMLKIVGRRVPGYTVTIPFAAAVATHSTMLSRPNLPLMRSL